MTNSESGNEPKLAVVAVHGVGDARPGEVLELMVEGMSEVRPRDFPGYNLTSEVINGQKYRVMRSPDGTFPDVFEANWSDIQRPNRSPPGALTHLLRLAFGMSTARFEWLNENGPARFLSQVLAFIIQAGFAWIAYPVVVGMIHSAFVGQTALLIIADIAILLLALFTYVKVHRWTKTIKVAGFVWITACIASIAVLHYYPSLTPGFVFVSSCVYALVQVFAAVAALLLAFTISIQCLSPRGLRFFPGLSFLAAFYVPIQIFSMLGAVLFAATLYLLNQTGNADGLKQFEQMFLTGIIYDLALVEFTAAGVVILLASLFGVFAVICRLSGNGKVAHFAFGFFLVVTPILLLIPTLSLITTFFFEVPGEHPLNHITRYLTNRLGADGILEIYTWSALRIVPWLAIVATPAAIVLDIIGDVILYILPDEEDLKAKPLTHRVATRTSCRHRVEQLLSYLDGLAEYDEIRIFAHSQGSVISTDVISDRDGQKSISVITFGSPIKTLYKKYLDWPDPSFHYSWWNRYRTGDYIGGSVKIDEVEIDDENVGRGGHTLYWKDPEVVRLLFADN